MQFTERLRRLPLGIWASVAEARPARAPGGESDAEGADAAARARLRRAADEMPGTVARLRQRVYGLVAVTEGFVPPGASARMKKVALSAALALAVRPYLTEADFARLYRPFAEVIPLETLPASSGDIDGSSGGGGGRQPAPM
jgi:hypothetical protein